MKKKIFGLIYLVICVVQSGAVFAQSTSHDPYDCDDVYLKPKNEDQNAPWVRDSRGSSYNNMIRVMFYAGDASEEIIKTISQKSFRWIGGFEEYYGHCYLKNFSTDRADEWLYFGTSTQGDVVATLAKHIGQDKKWSFFHSQVKFNGPKNARRIGGGLIEKSGSNADAVFNSTGNKILLYFPENAGHPDYYCRYLPSSRMTDEFPGLVWSDAIYNHLKNENLLICKSSYADIGNIQYYLFASHEE